MSTRSRADRKLALIRSAKTGANYKYGMGGRPKEHRPPKPVTLAKVNLPDEPLSIQKPTEGQ